MKNVRYTPGNDYITVWAGDAPPEEVVSVGYGFTNDVLPVTLEFVTAYLLKPDTAGFKYHMLRLREEARRILLGIRTDSLGAPASPIGLPGTQQNAITVAQALTGRQWLKPGARTEPHPWAQGTLRFTWDWELQWRFREVKTS
jgi:hypothetical protein